MNQFHSFLVDVKEKYSGKTAFRFQLNDEVFEKSYESFFEDVHTLAAAFHANGFKGNENIAVIGANSYEWIVSYFAIAISGNVTVPIDKDLPSERIIEMFADYRITAVVYDTELASTFCAIKGDIPATRSFLKIGNSVIEEWEEGYEAFLLTGIQSPMQFADPEDENKLSVLLSTSGTTGKSKGVMLSQKNLCLNAYATNGLTCPFDETMNPLPFHHSLAGIAIFMVLARGKAMCITTLRRFQKDLGVYRPTLLYAVPMILENYHKNIWEIAKKQDKLHEMKTLMETSNQLLGQGIDVRHKLFDQINALFGGRIRSILSGGAPISPEIVSDFRSWGIEITVGYGITEVSPVVSLNYWDNYDDSSVGLPLPGVEVTINNPDENGKGEICVAGDCVMSGYYNNPEATEDSLKNGVFFTGDIGMINERGFIIITGRKKNLIITSNGKNVSPEELELPILKLPYVHEAVVYQDKNEIAVQVYFKPESVDEKSKSTLAEQLRTDIQKINAQWVNYKRITKISTRDTEFEKTPSKKIKRDIFYTE